MHDDLPQSYAVWLMPRQREASFLQSLIDDLASRYSMSGFPAHATLCSGEWSGEIESLCSIVQALASQMNVTTLPTAGINYIDKQFQYFYIAIEAREFRDISGAALDRLCSARPPKPCPHLSLMYGADSKHIDRTQLASDLKEAIPQTITFDRLVCVTPRKNDWSDLTGWHERVGFSLSS